LYYKSIFVYPDFKQLGLRLRDQLFFWLLIFLKMSHLSTAALKPRSKLKRLFFLGLLAILLVSLSPKPFLALIFPPRFLEVIFCDVGQGDAALIKIPTGQVIVIDGGPDGSLLRCLGKNLPFNRRQIDFLILSHYHDDHITGLPELARRYQIKNFIYAPDEYQSAPRDELRKYLDRTSSEIVELAGAASIDFQPDCRLNLLNPAILSVPPDGNNSLITRLQCRGKAFLFSGDNEAKVEKALLASDFVFAADVFKASHHGSKTSNTADFLQAGGFRQLIISVGTNKFGHPSPEVLERARDLGISIRRTDQSGTIKLIVK